MDVRPRRVRSPRVAVVLVAVGALLSVAAVPVAVSPASAASGQVGGEPSTAAVGQVDGLGQAADWWYSPRSPRAGEPVTLVAPDLGDGASYAWDVDGDGEAELDGRIASHAFEAAGEHRVTLVVSGSGDGTTRTSKTIVVENGGVADGAGDGPGLWHAPLEPAPGEPVTLVAEDRGDGATYGWDVDADGEVDLQGRVASHAFEAAGEHEVTLTVRGSGGGTTRTSEMVVVEGDGGASADADAREGATFWYAPLEPAPGERVTLVADPAGDEVDAYEWDLDGDGTVDERGRVVTATLDDGARVQLSVRRPDGRTETVERTVIDRGTTAAGSETEGGSSTGERDSSDDGGAEGTPVGTPGFGVAAAVVALALAGWYRCRGETTG